MLRHIYLLFLTPLALLDSTAGGEVALQNDSVRIRINRGVVTSLYDRARDREFICAQPDSKVGLFRLALLDEDGQAVEIDASEMTAELLQSDSERAAFRFATDDVEASVTIRLLDSRGELRWSARVELHNSNLTLARFDFPVLQMRRPLGDNPNFLMAARGEGRLFPPFRRALWMHSPANLAAQLIAYFDTTSGCVIWTDDAEGNVKSFGFDSISKNNIAVKVQHRMPFQRGAAWEMPYRVRTAFCDGSWWSAADIYRDYQREQPWCARKFHERTDIPPLLHNPLLCISSQLTTESLDDLPERLMTYRKRFGVPLVYRPLGWEKNGNWTGIDYFPPSIGEERFKLLADRLKKQQIYICGFISGFYWTYSRENAPVDLNDRLLAFFREQGGERVCERRANGELYTRFFEGRHFARICRGTEFGRKFLQRVASKLFDLGVTLIHDDQDFGASPDGVNACFDKSHGHPVPCGAWSTRVMFDAFREIKTEAARRGIKNFVLTKEGDSELFNMTLHGYQSRNFHDAGIPTLVPLVQYLNHEYIPVIFGWVTAKSENLRMLSGMLIYGQIPCIAFWGKPVEPVQNLPEDAVQLLDDYFEAMRLYAKPFLLYGRMLHPALKNVPMITVKQKRWKSRVFNPPRELHLPLILQSAWEDAGGNVGVFAINLTREERTVNCTVPGGGWRANFYSGGKLSRTFDVNGGESLQWRIPPKRLQAIIFRKSR